MVGLLAVTGQLFLFLLAIVCIFMILHFLRNPKSKAKSGETLSSMLKMSKRRSERESLKMSRRELLKG